MFENVVVGASDSDGATRAVRSALEVTRSSGGTLHLVMATRRRRLGGVATDRRSDASGGRSTEVCLDEFRRMAATRSVHLRTYPSTAQPADAIAKVASEEGADLIVVGSRAARGGRRLSTVPRELMDKAECAVLVV